MPEAPGPTVRRRRLGIELRRLRQAAGVAIPSVAERLECSVSTVSRIETGETVVHIRDVREMLDMYGLTDGPHREALLALAREAQRHGWWERYRVPPDLERYIGLEADAAEIRAFEVNLVHGLLQTEDYARALASIGSPALDSEDTVRKVAVRMRRQEVLRRQPEPVHLWLIQDEAALHRLIGGPAVMHAQLIRVIEAADRPNVTIQVLPFSMGAYRGMGGPFAVVRPADPEVPPVVYLESVERNLYLKKLTEVERYGAVFDNLRQSALSVDDSKRFLRAVAAKFEKTER